MTYTLLGADGVPYASDTPGALGGHSRQRVYGRLDCPVALSLIRRGRNRPEYRVFFASEADASTGVADPRGASARGVSWVPPAAPNDAPATNASPAAASTAARRRRTTVAGGTRYMMVKRPAGS